MSGFPQCLARHLRRVLLCACTAQAAAVGADDTEIYVDLSFTRGFPNVLFIIDTSLSMMTPVFILPYDPQTDYAAELANAGGTGMCGNDRLYYQRVPNQRTTPHCGTAFAPFSGGGISATNQYIDKDTGTFSCSAAWVALDMDNPDPDPGPNSDPDSSGVFSGEWSAYDPARTYGTYWGIIDPADARNSLGIVYDHIECITDQGDDPGLVHGPGAPGAGTPPYASERSPPYASAQDPNPFWGQEFRSEPYVLYTGNYLNYLNYVVNHAPPGLISSRMAVVKGVLESLIRSISPINAGMMAFDENITDPSGDGGADVLYPITPLSVPGSPERQDLIDEINALTDPPAGGTSLAESLYEAYLYWTGQPMEFGAHGPQTSVPGSHSSGTYVSPMPNDCSANYQIVLTDGLPARDSESDAAIQGLIHDAYRDGSWLSPALGASATCMSDGNGTTFTDSCFDDLAEYMNKVDLTPGPTRPIEHTVATYVVGFQLGDGPVSSRIRLLFDNASTYGGGGFHEAGDNAQIELAIAFRQIIGRIVNVSSSFTSPAVSVNALNRLVHNNQLYYALFEPGYANHWPGNIKRYQLAFVRKDADGDGITGANEGVFEVQDANGVSAVDLNTGQFNYRATSWWRLPGFGPDGNEVSDGGLAHRLFDWDPVSQTSLPNANRVFTYVRDYPLSFFKAHSPVSLPILSEGNAALNIIQESNPLYPIWRSHFGLPMSYPDGDFAELIRWTRGVDTEDIDGDGDMTEGRPQMGAPLHTRPQVVTYSVDPNTQTQDDVIFSMTNDGYFHASKADQSSATDRLEEFAFIPSQLLQNMDRLRANAGSQPEYGLDGGLTVWRKESDDDDFDIEPSDGDHVIAYFGMRRGGRSFFALDATDLSSPKLQWVINPDSPAQDALAAPHFQYLGQSWAEPQLTKVYVDNGTTLEERDAIILSGGYYPNGHDAPGFPRDPGGDNQGNAIYIIDAKTAEVLWWASKPVPEDPPFESSDMLWSIPAHPRVIDTDIDGIADMLVAADLGGQVWRFDIRNQLQPGDSRKLEDRITGGVIADLQKQNSGHTLTIADNRRFYYTPDVALVAVDDDPYFAIAVGSGYRAKPLDEDTEERFYLIKDYSVKGPPTTGSPPQVTYDRLYEDDLLDVTTINLADSGTSLSAGQEAKLANGWFLKLDQGEKVLAPSITVAGSVIFTTYTPPVNIMSTNSCAPNSGSGTAYVVRVDDARPVFDFTVPDADLTLDDRKQGLQQKGIPAQPLVVYTTLPGGQAQAVVLVGKEALRTDTDSGATANLVTRSFWYEKTP